MLKVDPGKKVCVSKKVDHTFYKVKRHENLFCVLQPAEWVGRDGVGRELIKLGQFSNMLVVLTLKR